MFLDEQTITVTEGENAITLRQHLNLAQDAHFRGELVAASRAFDGYLSDAQWEWLLLRAYATGWSGPAFTTNGRPVPFSLDAVDRLDPADDLVIAARKRAWEIHFPRLPEDAPKGQKKRRTPSGSASSADGSPA
jgi:hypothetical protein